MAEANNRVLRQMLDRLFASIANGPSLNCRPHSSRQRIDFVSLARLEDVPPGEALARVLGPESRAEVAGRVAAPAVRRAPLDATPKGERTEGGAPDGGGADAPAESDDAAPGRKAWLDQQSLLAKLRVVAEEARTYEDDTGVYVLNIGFPLISLSAGGGATGAGGRGASRRILAPLAFVPVSLVVKSGTAPAVELECRSDELDRVVPNEALLAWLERQTGKPRGELFADSEGTDPWREVRELTGSVARMLGIDVPAVFGEQACPASIPLIPAPRADESDGRPAILCSAVLGLFPIGNQGLLRDTQAMVGGESLQGPVERFISAGVDADELEHPPEPEAGAAPSPVVRSRRVFADERLVATADPCQARAVGLARTSPRLVIHGPPGTGKSQTITNIIGDHLARGERVLFVCEKRTALDVVANRLSHLGLGELCALVHDPQRDQRDLYRSIREQLEALPEARTNAAAAKQLERTDEELQRLHAELTEHRDALMLPGDGDEPSFHELVGEWLSLGSDDAPHEGALEEAALAGTTLRELDQHAVAIQDALARAQDCRYAQNPWVACAGVSLAGVLARPVQAMQGELAACERAAGECDATRDATVPPFLPGVSLDEQALGRAALAEELAGVMATVGGAARAVWSTREAGEIAREREQFKEAETHAALARGGPMDAELMLVLRGKAPDVADIGRQIVALESYLGVARAWYGRACLGRRSAAAKVLHAYGQPLSPEAAERVRGFLHRARSMLVIHALVEQCEKGPPQAAWPDAAVLDRAFIEHQRVLELLHGVLTRPSLAGLEGAVRGALAGPSGAAASLVDGLRRSRDRARLLATLEETVRSCGLFDAGWFAGAQSKWRAGEEARPELARAHAELPTLESVLRIRQTLAQAPPALSGALSWLMSRSITPSMGAAALRRAVLAGRIRRRLQATPALHAADARRLRTVFDRCRELDRDKKTLVRDSIVHLWVERQKARLLVGTGSRLNGGGAEVKRRLTIRGKRAMRLRQVVSLGAASEGGDPLLDLRPVWMASPETVAQVFDRTPVFDIVIFDEASQCRLEEALPVLTRARRVVVAGDPKQLPPTRFFESAVIASENEEIETDQQLFESQQSEVEDLLGAALSLDVQSSYLDVHYRSRNADLIAFSNHQFYGSRLQAIPAHPSNRSRFAPLTLYSVKGTYTDRTNLQEAEQVCRIVRDLLRRAEPPSIGIGCFNLAQRDLIVERLDAHALEDEEFAQRLAAARVRRGTASLEGLFVKNLENVQGDERDHLIISTTYGPDAQGRFYRRFGPLAQPGGGRRLNVLVTRAREEVHLVTSIPPEVYRTMLPVPEGQAPSGAWLLFAYLSYAEQLAAAYEAAHRRLHPEAAAPDGIEPRAATGTPESAADVASGFAPAVMRVNPALVRSSCSEALAGVLSSRSGASGEVYWGNEGFCVDIALGHPARAEDVTVGVLCDWTRFTQAHDPVEWDVFRTQVLEDQGWTLERVWSPSLFRDPPGTAAAIEARAAAMVSGEDEQGALRVQQTPRRPG